MAQKPRPPSRSGDERTTAGTRRRTCGPQSHAPLPHSGTCGAKTEAGGDLFRRPRDALSSILLLQARLGGSRSLEQRGSTQEATVVLPGLYHRLLQTGPLPNWSLINRERPPSHGEQKAGRPDPAICEPACGQVGAQRPELRQGWRFPWKNKNGAPQKHANTMRALLNSFKSPTGSNGTRRARAN